MRNKIGAALFIMGFLAFTALKGLENNTIFERYCTRGKEGYYRFRKEVLPNQKKTFCDKFEDLIDNFRKKREYARIEACREFWHHLRQDDYFDTDNQNIIRQQMEIDAIFFRKGRLLPNPGEENSFNCLPYLKALEFTVEFPRPYMEVDQAVEIIQPDGTVLNTANAREHQMSATIQAPYPPEGTWRFIRKDRDVRVKVKTIYRKLKYLEPLSPVQLDVKHKIKFKVFGPWKTNSFVQSIQIPLYAIITIETPQKNKDMLNAFLDPNEPGVFISDSDYSFDLRGKYHIQFEASVISITGKSEVVLKSDKNSVRVFNAPMVKPVLESPEETIRSCFGSINRDIIVGFYTNDRRVPLQDILKPGKIKVEATVELLDTTSGTIIKTVVFQMEPRGGNLVGTLKVKLPITGLSTLLRDKRSMKLTIHFNKHIFNKNYLLLEPTTTSQRYEFPLKVREGFLTYLVLAGLLLIFPPFTILFLRRPFLRLYDWMKRSKDIPVLVYRNNSYKPKKIFTEEIEVDKRKIKFKREKKKFKIPGKTETWKPEIRIIKNCVRRGVNITLSYERFGKKTEGQTDVLPFIKALLKRISRNEEQGRFRKVVLRTLHPQRPLRHLIEELKDWEMIFELRIKESKQDENQKM